MSKINANQQQVSSISAIENFINCIFFSFIRPDSHWKYLEAFKDKVSHKWGYRNKYFYSIVIMPVFNYTSNFSESLANVKVDGKTGYIKQDGSYLIEPKFDTGGNFFNGFAIIEVKEKFGFIRKDGSYLIEPIFQDIFIGGFNEGYAPVKLNNKWKFIREDLSYLITPEVDFTLGFNEGYAPVQINNKWGYIRTDGSYFKEPQFDYATNFCRRYTITNGNNPIESGNIDTSSNSRKVALAFVNTDGNKNYMDLSGRFFDAEYYY
jgi:WG containing repeat